MGGENGLVTRAGGLGRRGFLGLVGAAIAAPAVSVTATTYGRLTVDGHRHHLQATGEDLRVYVDGVEATRCYEADDVEGYALVWCTNPNEHRFWTKIGHRVGAGGACRFRLTGRVVIVPGARRP